MSDERVLGYVDMLEKTGRIRSTACTLVITDQRAIVARVTDEVKRADAAEQRAAGRGGGFLSSLFGGGGNRRPLGERYLSMSADAIARETPDNVVFTSSTVSEALVSSGERGVDEDVTERFVYLRITAAGQKHEYFSQGSNPGAPELAALLRTPFGSLVR